MVDTSSIKPSAAGFLSTSGQLRGRDEIAREDKALAAARDRREVSAPQSPSTDSLTLSRSALLKVEERTRSQVNSAAETLNSAQDRLQAARKNLSQQDKVLKRLEKVQDPEKRAELEEKFKQLQSEQDELSQQSKSAAQDGISRGPLLIQVGNKTVGVARSSAEPIEKAQSVDLSSPKDIAAARARISQEREEVSVALKQNRSDRNSLKNVSSQAFDNLGAISNREQKRIEDPNVASAVANSVRDSILALGGVAVAAFDPSGIDRTVLDSL